ncbi:MAG: hypothetical protein RLZZ409_208, partial [Pseudomonadota bacterium]
MPRATPKAAPAKSSKPAAAAKKGPAKPTKASKPAAPVKKP